MGDHPRVERWISDYESAWRSPGTDQLGVLFTEDATYLQSPYSTPITGMAAIAEMWEAQREGPEEVFALESQVIAVDGDTAVVRALVSYGEPVAQEYTDLWVVRLRADGRAWWFEEWPFWPGRPTTDGIGD